MLKKSLPLVFLSIALVIPASAEDPKQAAQLQPKAGEQAGSLSEEPLSVTNHSLKLGGKTLAYKASAGYLELKDESGKPRANMFFVSYVKDPKEEGARRPITFIFNGGPGAASVWLHLGAIGPKRAWAEYKGDAPLPPPYKLVDNEYTWLAFSDLVFIDPVETGFSRALSEEASKKFFGMKEDIESVGAFIRLYTTRFERWLSPKFVAGESYGTTRAVGLSGHLYENYGMELNGLILMSSALNFQAFSFELGNDLPYVLFLPSYAAAAWHHRKLAPEIQGGNLQEIVEEAENWAVSTYMPALALGNLLSDPDRDRIVNGLMRYTGLSAQYIKNSNIRIDRSGFMNELLRSENLHVGLMDSRATSYGKTGNILNDPGLVATVGPYVACMNSYVREELNFQTDLPYIYLSSETNGQWNWGSAIGGYVNVMDDLQQAMRRTKHLKVFVASGYFDLDTPCFGAKYVMNHLNLAPSLREHIVMEYYEGGHMLYTEPQELKKLTSDVASFVKASIPGNM